MVDGPFRYRVLGFRCRGLRRRDGDFRLRRHHDRHREAEHHRNPCGDTADPLFVHLKKQKSGDENEDQRSKGIR